MITGTFFDIVLSIIFCIVFLGFAVIVIALGVLLWSEVLESVRKRREEKEERKEIKRQEAIEKEREERLIVEEEEREKVRMEKGRITLEEKE